MNKNYEMYKIYADVAYTWYQGNSDLKKATKLVLLIMIVIYLLLIYVLFNTFKSSSNFEILFATTSLVITAIAIYFAKGMKNLIDVCSELQRQESYWENNNKTLPSFPVKNNKKSEDVFRAVQEIIKSKLDKKESEEQK